MRSAYLVRAVPATRMRLAGASRADARASWPTAGGRTVSAWVLPAEPVENGDRAFQAIAIRLRDPGDRGDN
jgi:hypothetical protein